MTEKLSDRGVFFSLLSHGDNTGNMEAFILEIWEYDGENWHNKEILL